MGLGRVRRSVGGLTSAILGMAVVVATIPPAAGASLAVRAGSYVRVSSDTPEPALRGESLDLAPGPGVSWMAEISGSTLSVGAARAGGESGGFTYVAAGDVQVGVYEQLFENSGHPAPSFTFLGAHCGDSLSRFELLALDRRGDGSIRYLRARFDQRCDDFVASTRGDVLVDTRTDDELVAGLGLDVESLSFPAAPWPGASAAKSVTVTNNGAADVHLGSVRSTVPDFVVEDDTCSLHTLPAGAQCTVSVRMDTDLAGPRHGELLIPADAATGWASVDLAGEADAGVHPVPENFFEYRNLSEGEAAATHRWDVRNGRVWARPEAGGVAMSVFDPRTSTSVGVWLAAADGGPLGVGPAPVATSGPWPSLARMGVGLHPLSCGNALGWYDVTELAYDDDGSVRRFAGWFGISCDPLHEIEGRFSYDLRSISEVPIAMVPSASSVDLEETRWTAPRTSSVTFRAPPGGPTTVSQAWARGEGLWLERDGCTGAVLAPGGTCEIEVAFSTPMTGPQRGAVVVVASAGAVVIPVHASMRLGDFGRVKLVSPVVVLDTVSGVGRARKAKGKMAPGAPELVSVAGVRGVSPAGVDAVLVQVTVSGARSNGTLNLTEAEPGGSSGGPGRSMSYATGGAVSSLVLAPVSLAGRFQLVSTARVDVHAELVAYLGNGAGDGGRSVRPGESTILYSPTFDIGAPIKLPKGKLRAGRVASIQLPGGPVFAALLTSNVTSNARIKFWPAGSKEPTIGWVPVGKGERRAVSVLLVPGADRRVNFRLSSGSLDLQIDQIAALEGGDDHTWDGRVLVAAPAPQRLVSRPNLGAGLTSIGEVDGDLTIALGDGIAAQWSTTGWLGTVNTWASVGSEALSLSNGWMPGVPTHMTRSGRSSSNLGVWPRMPYYTTAVSSGTPTGFAFDVLGAVVDGFSGYVLLSAPARSRVPSASLHANPAMVIRAVKRVL